MPATYEVRGGVAYPPRVKYEGERCPECTFRGRHMPWCSRSKPLAAPAKVIPIRPATTTAAPAKRSRGFDFRELGDSMAARDYAWACGATPDAEGRDAFRAKVKAAIERSQRKRLTYIDAGLADPRRRVTDGRLHFASQDDDGKWISLGGTA